MINKGNKRINLVNDPKYNWTQKQLSTIKICMKGEFYYKDSHYKEDAALTKLNVLFKSILENLEGSRSSLIKKTAQIFDKIRGHYSFIIDAPDYTLAAVDRIRSYPIFYTDKDPVSISNCAIMIQNECALHKIDKLSLDGNKQSLEITDKIFANKGVKF